MSSVTSPSVENIPRHRDHRSGDHDLLITISPESLIIFRRNSDHDHPGIAITITRNRWSPSSGIRRLKEIFGKKAAWGIFRSHLTLSLFSSLSD